MTKMAVYGSVLALLLWALLGTALGQEAWPTIPPDAEILVVQSAICPSGETMTGVGYDTNANGDWEIEEYLDGSSQRVALLYYDALTESQLITAYVRDGDRVVKYTDVALFMADYPSVCAFLHAKETI